MLVFSLFWPSFLCRIDHTPPMPKKKAIQNSSLPKGLRDASQALDVRDALNNDPWLANEDIGAVDRAIQSMTSSDMNNCLTTDECDLFYGDHSMFLSQSIPYSSDGYTDVTIFDAEGEHTVSCDKLFDENVISICELDDGTVLV